MEGKTVKMESGKGMAVKVAVPVIIGIAVVYFLFRKDFNVATFRQIHLSGYTIAGLLFVILAVAARETGMALRFKILTSGVLNFRKSLYTTFLCEFTSCVTPTSVGGSALSMIFMNREGVNLGKAATYTLIILFLDNVFYSLFVPFILLTTNAYELFGMANGGLEEGLETLFWVAYGAMAGFTVVLGLGIFFIPRAVKRLLCAIFCWKLIRRWKPSVEETTDNMVAASAEVRSKTWGWWTQLFLATSLSWIGRFMVVNAIFFAILPDSPQVEIFARQVVVWTLLMFTPTPGGSGVSEWLFDKYYFDLIPGTGVVMVIALLWRIFTYYIYLIAGICLLPSFFRKKNDRLSQRKNQHRT